MSLSVEPDYQDFIVRLHDILVASPLVFPRTVGLDNDAEDLVNQIILNELPIPQLPVDGPGPPHIFISQSRTPLIQTEQMGRDSRDVQGSKRVTLEFYIVIISRGIERQESESKLFNIISAVTTELSKNKRLAVPLTFTDPKAATHTFEVVPYIFDITNKELHAKNIVVRPVVGVNLRT